VIRRVVAFGDFVCSPLQPLPAVENPLPLRPVGFLFYLAGSSDQPLPAEMRGGEFLALCALPSTFFLGDEIMLPVRSCFWPLEFISGAFLG
jgi:hypothetical protein